MAFFVYVLHSPACDRLYIGQTDDLEKRVQQHNDPNNDLSQTTKRWPGPWQLVYHEQCATRTEAVRRERQLKSASGRRWIRRNRLSGPSAAPTG